MADMSLKKHPAPEQDAKERIHNFDEVSLGYTAQAAVAEADRCIGCKNPKCVEGCPVGVDIPCFISKIKSGDFAAAYNTIYATNTLPAVCGRVCPQESQCEARCVRGLKGEPVAIGRLERFAADYMSQAAQEQAKPVTNTGKKVAVVGSGPAGLTCAAELAKKGYRVTVFEAFHELGGVLAYGIPEFRLPKSIVRRETDSLKNLGVRFEPNTVIGKSMSIDDLFAEGIEAVFLGTGAGLPKFMNIEGESLVGVYSANEYLTRINLMKAYRDDYDTPVKRYKKVVVVGGGNVAMDAARCARRMGAEVYLAYRRTEKEMPARAEELEHAKQEGITVLPLTAPTRVIGDENGFVIGLECRLMQLGEPDESGRASFSAVEGSEFVIETDAVISAIGTSPNPILTRSAPDIRTNRYGCIEVAEGGLQTSKKGVFAGGDAVSGAATVILAMGAGKQAAAEIDDYLLGL